MLEMTFHCFRVIVGDHDNSPMKVAFLDRDGTLIFEPPDRQIDSLEKFSILPGVVEGLKKLKEEGYELVMVTNQDGKGTSSFPEESFLKPQEKLLEILRGKRIEFYKIFVCPHLEEENCSCRKPKTGLVSEFLSGAVLDDQRSFVLGDRPSDLEFAENLGVRSFLTRTNGAFPRLASADRKTKETEIFAQVNLDGRGNHKIRTGLSFFDHLLEQFSKHSLVDVTLIAEGDLHVDEHHTVEDTALVLGEAVSRALGGRKGIGRFGFLVPLDDSLAEVALDLGGRPYLVFNAKFKRERIGDLPTEMIEHFFHSFSASAKANLHVNLRYGKNEHHGAEAIFKAFAKAMRMACEMDPRRKEEIPSTKGVLG